MVSGGAKVPLPPSGDGHSPGADTGLLDPLVSEEAVASSAQPLSPTPGAPPLAPGLTPLQSRLHTAICVGLSTLPTA